MDKSSFSAHGDITTAAWIAGLHHYALDFESGTPDYVNIPSAINSHLNFTSESFSIIARIKTESLGAQNHIFCRGVDAQDGYRWYITANGGLNFTTYQAAASQVQSSSAGDITNGNWFTVGVSRVGASVILFNNGIDVNAGATSHTNPKTSSEDAQIGIYNDKSGSPLDGVMEFFRVFGGIALSATDHLWFHNQLK